jgi:hypothetical protein
MNARLAASLFFILLILGAAGTAVRAEQREIMTEGEYVMGAGETMAVAEERALKKAQQAAAEQAGAFVKSYSQVKNLALAEDVVEVLANHAMKVTVLDRKKTVVGDLDAIRFVVRIKALVNTDEVEANLRKLREDSSAVESYKKLKTEYDRQAREIEELKKQLAGAGADGRRQVLARISEEEKRFKASLWLEKGGDYSLSPEMSLKAYDTALELNPNLAAAWAGKARIGSSAYGICCDRVEKEGKLECDKEFAALYQAFADASKAIMIDPRYAEPYALRAEINNHIRTARWLIQSKKTPQDYNLLKEMRAANQRTIMEDIDQAIALSPESHAYYEKRANYADAWENPGKPVADMNRAIELCRKSGCWSLGAYYRMRAGFHLIAGNEELSQNDLKTAKELERQNSPAQLSPPGEFARLLGELYFSFGPEQRQKVLGEATRKIAAGEGSANDYRARALLADEPDDARVRDLAEAINLYKKGTSRDGEELVLAASYYLKATFLKAQKKDSESLRDFNDALAIIDRRLPDALKTVKISELEKYGEPQKIAAASRAEAEAVQWISFKTAALRDRAALYEEMGSPEKARPDYELLCTKFSDKNSCRDLERLK